MPLHLLDPELGVFQITCELRRLWELRRISHSMLHMARRRGMALLSLHTSKEGPRAKDLIGRGLRVALLTEAFTGQVS